MSAYLLGVASPLMVFLLIVGVGHLVECYRNRTIGFEHKGCRGYHQFRHWLPAPFIRRVLMPISAWRCNRGAQVPLMEWHSQGRDRSNNPAAAA